MIGKSRESFVAKTIQVWPENIVLVWLNKLSSSFVIDESDESFVAKKIQVWPKKEVQVWPARIQSKFSD